MPRDSLRASRASTSATATTERRPVAATPKACGGRICWRPGSWTPFRRHSPVRACCARRRAGRTGCYLVLVAAVSLGTTRGRSSGTWPDRGVRHHARSPGGSASCAAASDSARRWPRLRGLPARLTARMRLAVYTDYSVPAGCRQSDLRRARVRALPRAAGAVARPDGRRWAGSTRDRGRATTGSLTRSVRAAAPLREPAAAAATCPLARPLAAPASGERSDEVDAVWLLGPHPVASRSRC